jgi:type IV fimbrial biogenesis protein FimT
MDVVRNPRHAAHGLSLIELITTTAVLGISLAVVVPGWSAFAQRNQVAAASNLLLTHLRFARSAAVNYQDFVSLCPSDDGINCSGDPQGWQRGYLVFRDYNGNRGRESNDTILRVQGPAANGLRLFSTAGRPAIRFRADGAAWSTNTTFSVCGNGDTASNRAVVLYGSGRARVDRKRPGNKAVTCS